MSGSLPKQFKQAQKASEKAGWTWERKTNHVTVRDASGEFVTTVSTTMYDGPLTKQLISRLRKAGCPGC